MIHNYVNYSKIIGNAIKFKKSDEPPKIHISARKDKKKREYIFSVSANGIGMETICRSYFHDIPAITHTRRIQWHWNRSFNIKKIVERHEGHIWVESEYRNGFTFYFTIP